VSPVRAEIKQVDSFVIPLQIDISKLKVITLGSPQIASFSRRGLAQLAVLLLAGIGMPSYGAPAPILVESRSTLLSERYAATDSDEQFGSSDIIETAPVAIETDQSKPSPLDLQYQMQVLQQEVMDLRGLVEQLDYELKRSKSVQDDRYLELDRRLQQKVVGLPKSQMTEVATGQGLGDSETLVSNTVEGLQGESIAETGIQDEKTYYDRGLNAIQARQYDQAVETLRAVIEHYPAGTYAANAYYWIGEVHAAKPEPDYEAARQALVQVVTGFPDSNKVPDAGFKLGKVYHLMGDCGRAKQTLESVAADFGDKSAGKLAEKYLNDQIDC